MDGDAEIMNDAVICVISSIPITLLEMTAMPTSMILVVKYLSTPSI